MSSERRILIAIDGSDHSLRALKFYAENLQQPSDFLVFVNVVEPPHVPRGTGTTLIAGTDAYADLLKEALDEGKKVGNFVRQKCRELGVNNGQKFVKKATNNAGAAIVDAAREERIDIIIMGNRGMGTLRRTFLGSVSDFVLHHAQKPVLIIPPEKSSSRKNSQEAYRKVSQTN